MVWKTKWPVLVGSHQLRRRYRRRRRCCRPAAMMGSLDPKCPYSALYVVATLPKIKTQTAWNAVQNIYIAAWLKLLPPGATAGSRSDRRKFECGRLAVQAGSNQVCGRVQPPVETNSFG